MTSKTSKTFGTLRIILTGTILCLVFLLGISTLAFKKAKETEKTSSWINHTQNVITSMQGLETDLFELMSAQRGYVLTGQKKYAVRIKGFLTTISKSITHIQKQTRDNEHQQTRIDELRMNWGPLHGFVERVLGYQANKERAKAVALIETGLGQVLVDKLKSQIESMIDSERRLLEFRLKEDQKVRQLSILTIALSSILSLALILTVLILLYRQYQHRLVTQKELEKSSVLQKTILEATSFAMIAADTNGIITLFNPAAEQLLGYRKEEILGKTPAVFHDPVEIATRAKELSESFKETVPVGFEVFSFCARKGIQDKRQWTYLHKSGRKIPVNLTINALKNSQDEIYGYIGIAYDLTQQLEYEHAIIRSRDLAEAGTQAKSEFLANMSHEIRTPMNAIMGMAELLNETRLDEEQKKYVEIFQRAGESLLNIINDILDLSKIEAGHFELDKIPFRLSEVVQKSVEIMALKAHQKGLELVVEMDEDKTDHFIGDGHRIRQIILNLLGNAVKFTKKGEIILKIRLASDEGPKRKIVIEVQDTGIGMNEEQVKKLFSRFSQADSSITKEFGGTGLGLNITRRITELMDGRIEVVSTLGMGSRFTVTVILDADPAPYESPYNIDLSRLKILIVDDNRTNRMIMTKILENLKAQVRETEDGQTALKMIGEAKAQKKPYDIVILDSRMPEMDGFVVAQEIQKNDELRGPILMMLTSDNRPGDLNRSLQLGLKSYLIKPILKKELLSAISSTLQSSISSEVEKHARKSELSSGKQLCILLADDNDENRLVIRSYLKNENCKIEEAKNGQEALDLFKQHAFDLILMDMQMPVMDGYTAARAIRNQESITNSGSTPILALTAYALKEEIDKSFEAGCNDHLSKPVSKNLFIQTVKKFTSLINVTIDRDLKDLIPEYLKKRHEEFQQIEMALKNENYTLIQSLGHKLRGSAGSYGFKSLSEVGKELEENAKVGNRLNIEKALKTYQFYLKNVRVNYR